MNTTMLIDYLTFSVKKVSKDVPFDLEVIADFLDFDLRDFTQIGSRMHYSYCYINPNGVNIYVASTERIDDMGICISMSGQGCRYFESHMKDGEMCGSGECWKDFFKRLRELNYNGYAVNVSRIDIAVDDKAAKGKPYLLDLDDVESCANGREFVSQFRTIEEYTNKKIFTGDILGRCLYFGSMKSSVYCRFYDKLAEQRVRQKGKPEALAELEELGHWVRMEFVFKQKQAIKIVNAICDAGNFSEFYGKVVNGYVRFVEPDNENVSRCTVKSWWARFIGTVERSNLSVGHFQQRNFAKICQYYLKYLSTTVFTMLSRVAPSDFFEMTYNSAAKRLKKKHLSIIEAKDCDEIRERSMSEWWLLLNPIHKERLELCSTTA